MFVRNELKGCISLQYSDVFVSSDLMQSSNSNSICNVIVSDSSNSNIQQLPFDNSSNWWIPNHISVKWYIIGWTSTGSLTEVMWKFGSLMKLNVTV